MSLSGKEFAENLRNGAEGLNERLARVLLKIGLKSVAEAQENFTGKDGPSDYLIGPRAITGNLRASLNADLVLKNDGPELFITAGKVKPIKYAAALEFGVPQRNLRPRLFLGRGIDKVTNKLPEKLGNVINVAIIGGK